jgi:tRNA (cmo5U34)-methyltransferase
VVSDTNAEIWKSDTTVREWVGAAATRDARHGAQWALLGALLPFDADAKFTFLDLGAGTGSAAQVLLELYPKAEVVLAEYSPQMIEQGTREMERFAGRFRYVEFDMLADRWPQEIPSELDAAVSSQCIHHLPNHHKQAIFSGVFAHLKAGSWYFNYDAVAAGDPLIETEWQTAQAHENPQAAHLAHHRSEADERRWENHVRHMIPLAPQLQFLAEAGFEGIDVFWKRLEEVIYGGRRPAK